MPAFGFGRRLCSARHFVDSVLFIVVSCVLVIFNVRPPKDGHGIEVPVGSETLALSRGNGRKRWPGFPADALPSCSRSLAFKFTIPGDSRARELITSANLAA